MLSKLNPFVRFAGVISAELCPTKQYCVGDSRLFLCIGGGATLTVSGVAHTLTEGTLAYLPPYVLYGFSDFSSDGDFVIYTVNFDFDQTRSDMRESVPKFFGKVPDEREEIYVPEPFSTPAVMTNGGIVREELNSVISLFFAKEQYYRDLSSAYVKCAMLKLLGAEAVSPDSPAVEVLSYIAKNYARRITNTDIAKEFNYHPNHLNRIVKAHTGKTLKEYLQGYRVKVAKRLLASTANTVTEISELCGFSSPSYFSEVFVRTVGLNPREYRNKIRSTFI